MRRRGNTLYSKKTCSLASLDEKPEVVVDEEGLPGVDVPLKRGVSDTNDYSSVFCDFGPMCQESQKERIFAGDIDISTRRKSKSLYTVPTSHLYDRDVMMEEFYGNQKLSKCFKSMIIGLKGVGKHELIEKLFSNNQEQNEICKQGFNFVCKSIETENMTKRYKFWLKDTQKKEENLSHLYNLYYKNVSTFIMIYNSNNRKSFDSLEEELMVIMRTIPQEKFARILICNTPDSTNIQVTEEEAAEFAKKYDIDCFINNQLTPDAIEKILGTLENPKFKTLLN